MADIFGKIGRTAEAIGEFSPQFRAEQRQIKEQNRARQREKLNLYLNIIKDRTGTWDETARKAAGDSIRRLPIFKSISDRIGGGQLLGKGWGGAMGGMPSGMGAQEIKIGPEGLPTTTYGFPTPTREIGKHMATLEPGSEEWLKAGKIGVGGTEVSVGVKAPPAGMMDKLASAYEFQGKLADVGDLFDPDVIGPLAGRWAGFREKYNIPLVETPTSDQVIFRQLTKMIADDLLRMRSGAAISIPEYERLVQMMPQPNLPAKSFKAKLKGLGLAFDRMIKARQRILRETGYIVPGETKLPSAEVQSNLEKLSIEELKRIAGVSEVPTTSEKEVPFSDRNLTTEQRRELLRKRRRGLLPERQRQPLRR